MCVVSMVIDRTYEDLDWWKKGCYPPKRAPYDPWPYTMPQLPQFPANPEVLRVWIKELEELIRLAKIYDKLTGQPDCEMEDKKKRLKDLADELGIEITIP